MDLLNCLHETFVAIKKHAFKVNWCIALWALNDVVTSIMCLKLVTFYIKHYYNFEKILLFAS